MKKFLMVATVPSMIGQFNMDNIHVLLDMGYEVHAACNYKDTSVWTKERIQAFKKELAKLGVKRIQIEFARTPYDVPRLIKSYRRLRKMIVQEHYDGLHCHTPVAGFIVRLAALGAKTKVLYTAHGFHFYKGAPFINWMIYYPVEKLCSYMTDTLITINKEDYDLAKKKMHAKHVVYVPGVGIDLKKFEIPAPKNNIRDELEIPRNAKLLLSVGELNDNKNHGMVIRALAEIPEVRNGNVYYIIAGQGTLEGKLKKLIEKLDLEKQVFMLGFRMDMAALYDSADVYVSPSFREGLSVALMEAMASELPVACSKIRGNTDLIDSRGGYLFHPDNLMEIREKLQRLLRLPDQELNAFGSHNLMKIKKFDKDSVKEAIKKVYGRLSENVGDRTEYGSF